MRQTLRRLGWLYIAALIVVLVADVLVGLTTEYGNQEMAGCNFYDAMVVGIECHGFAGAKSAEMLLNWPFLLLYGPLFAFFSLWSLAIAVLIWVPPVYLAVTYLRGRNAT